MSETQAHHIAALLAGLLLGTCGCLAAEPSVVKDGWDWSLPEAVAPVPFSGFVTWGNRRFHESITVSGVHIRWKDLNPAPGRYNWKLLTDRMDKNRQAGMRTGLHLMGVERKGVPDWVVEKFSPPVIDVPVLQENQPWRIQTVPPWHPDVDRAFHDFLTAFGKTGIARRDDVVYAYIHGISASRGEELFLRKQDAEVYEKRTGLTPKVFAAWLRRRVDGMLGAFQGVEHKLAWMSGGPVGPNQAYREATADIWKYAIDRGCGIRGGGIDFQHGLFSEPAWGSSLTPEGYCVVDDTKATIAKGRFRGDENEEYGKYWEWRFGAYETYPYRHRICSLRGLQMRQNFQYVSPATLELNPTLNEYVRLTQGRRRDSSPDAWAYLRQCQIRRWPKNYTVKNMERWLIQRDVNGSRSVACERVDRHRLPRDPEGVHYDLDARRTDHANGQDGLAFQLDKAFWPRPAAAAVKVTFTDRAKATWRLVTTDGRGRTARSAPVVNVGDGKRKTATFRIADLAAARAMPGKMDFRLITEGPGDLTVTLVRIVNPNFKNPPKRPETTP